MAVVVTKREVTDKARGGARFTGSFAGNLVSCAAGTATINYIEKQQLIKNAKKIGDYLLNSFKDLSETKEARIINTNPNNINLFFICYFTKHSPDAFFYKPSF